MSEFGTVRSPRGARPGRLARRLVGPILVLALGLMPMIETAAAEDGRLARGQAVYHRHCQVCHGPEGKGDGPEAPFLSPRPSSLLSASTSTKSDADLLAIIETGKPRSAMPGFKQTLSEDDRHAVLAYLRSLIRFHRSLTPSPPPS